MLSPPTPRVVKAQPCLGLEYQASCRLCAAVSIPPHPTNFACARQPRRHRSNNVLKTEPRLTDPSTFLTLSGPNVILSAPTSNPSINTHQAY